MYKRQPSTLEGKKSPDGKGILNLKRGIEVGHIFKLGKKYSEILNLKIQSEDKEINPEMGCYGIGASRIVAAAIEQNHDDKGIIWPESLAPFEVAIVEVNPKNKREISDKCSEIYDLMRKNEIDVLRKMGVKFKIQKWQLKLGPQKRRFRSPKN